MYLRGLTHYRARKRLGRKAPGTEPLVYYGQDHVPGKNEMACGGIIKVQDLQDLYPNKLSGANILYLVSSKLPAFAPELADYAKKNGIKIVVNQNGTAYPAWHGPGWEKTNQPLKKVLERADYVFYQSHFCKRAADLHLVPIHGKYEILHNPVDTGTFVPSRKKPEGHRLISFGSFNQFYRIRCGVETVAALKERFPDIHLTFAGQYHWCPDQGRALSELQRLINERGVAEHVTVKGKYTQSELIPLLHEHHVALHTKYNDPCPRLVVEAMACGLPIVYSCSGGVPELVGKSGGIGVPAPRDWETMHPPEAEKLAAAVTEIFNSYHYFSHAARKQSVACLDIGHWLERHKIVFKEQLV